MLKLFSLLSSNTKQLAAARNVLEHVAEQLDAKFSVRLWDGSMIPLGRNVDPRLSVSIKGRPLEPICTKYRRDIGGKVLSLF